MAAAGRPTKYNDEMQKKADDYAQNYKEFGEQVVPSVCGLALALGVSKSTVYLWGEEHPIFSDTLTQIIALQETKLVNMGLEGKFNPTITKLMLANHGYHEKQDLNVDANINPIKIEFDDND